MHRAPSGRAGRTEWLRSLGGTLVCLLTVAACSASASGTSGKVTISPAVTSASGADISPASTGRVLSAALSPPGVLAAGASGGVDRGLAHRTSACATPRSPGWVAVENARAGTPERAGAPDGDAVLGYFDRGSVGCGDRVGVHLGVGPGRAARRVWLAAYRIGWYGGAGARLAWRSPTLWVSSAPVPSGVSAPHLVTATWPTSLSVNVDAGWLPGFYLVVPQDAGGGGPAGPAVPLVVRDDGGIEPILFKASTLTWNAYNDWGGWSLYHGPNGSHAEAVADRARVVALHRPLTGAGYQQMTLMDLPVVRLAEQLSTSRRIDVAYTTDVDVDRDPGQLSQHAEVVSGGHSEYWTTSMYDGLQAAAAAGTNLVFLGANNLWWHARLEGGGATTGGTSGASPRAAEPDREVVYRVLTDDPAARVDPQAATVQWQAWPLRRDPAALLGQSHAAIAVDGSLQLLDAPRWFTAGTGLSAGAILPEAVGNEADGFNPRGHNPANTQIFAAALLTGGHRPMLVSTSYSTQPSGGAVFAAGSTDWACAPTGSCADKTIPPGTGQVVAALTRNVLLALFTPKAGLTHPARATPLMNATTHAPDLAPAALGSYGGADGDGTANRTRH